jgi:hypothetical protein
VRFSLRTQAPEPLDESEFFRPIEWHAPAMTLGKLNDLMIEAEASANSRNDKPLVCPVGDCQWATESIKGTALELRRHLVTSH